MPDPTATAAVPVCGITTPHNHSSFDDPIDCAWRDRQPTTAATATVQQHGEEVFCRHCDGRIERHSLVMEGRVGPWIHEATRTRMCRGEFTSVRFAEPK